MKPLTILAGLLMLLFGCASPHRIIPGESQALMMRQEQLRHVSDAVSATKSERKATILEGQGLWRGEKAGEVIAKIKDHKKSAQDVARAPPTRSLAAANDLPVKYPVGCVLSATAVAPDPTSPVGYLIFNLDMRPGGVDENGEQYYWGVRRTKEGSNGYLHDDQWVGLEAPGGDACSSWGGIFQNSVADWVRVSSWDEAIAKGPNAYGPSRCQTNP